MIIGISGALSSGKDSVADMLEQKGFDHISLSQILRELAKEQNIPIDVDHLTPFGNSLQQTKGNHFLAELALERAEVPGNTIISSIRQPGEVSFLKQNGDFYFIYIDADPRVRFDRLQKRNRAGDPQTFEDFVKNEQEQMDGKSGGMNLNKCKEMADYIIENNGTFEEFTNKVDEVIKEIEQKEVLKEDNGQ